MTDIPEFTAEQYLNSTEPFEWLYSHRNNRFEMKQLSVKMARQARDRAGLQGFISLFNEYVATVREMGPTPSGIGNQTNFEGQTEGLWCGAWVADDSGIRGTDRMGFEVTACPHPIIPVRRLTNIDTGMEKIELAYRRGKEKWRTHIFDKSVIADTHSIIRLSDYGIAVNSDNAKYLVKYLGDVESLNYDRMEALNSVGRLGWIEGYGFSPYVDNLVFDGEDEYTDRFQSVRERGDYNEWKRVCRSIRATEGIVTRLVLAASFASVLVKPCSCLPFFLHLWGGTEAGKTVGLMMAASVWANPEMGRYIQTFNATGVSKEFGATFLNSLPLMLDELQLIEGNRAKFQQMVYELAEGVGRTRGKKSGGVQKTGTWRNCIMTTGEFPLIDSNTAAGAVNRIIEIYCRDIHLFSNNCLGGAKAIARFFQRNYGFAGQDFVKRLQERGAIEAAAAMQDRFAADIAEKGDVSDKQAASAALILTADRLAENWIFHDGITLEPLDILPWLTTKESLNQNRRALDFLYDQISINIAHFQPERAAERTIEIWGDSDEQYIYIIKTQFARLLNENGFNAESFIQWARQNEIIRPSKDGKSTVHRRILGKPVRCVWLRVREEDWEELDEDDGDELPF